MPTYIICIGSNYNKEVNLLFARNQLTALFPSIRFADEEETEPFLLSNPALFTNQVARFQTDEAPGKVKAKLKAIENLMRREASDEDIALDIDLLMCDDLVLKPEDMEREYIKKGIRSLNEM